ncbi:conserved hypothetical protein [Culex quinquefasciatus]|uniref:Carboxylesterase type B domain-containing protein n=1 Tax=Culex quinquefasciatus TaxID=7176 RepID=B0WVW6_CULQU|nr:conserved hypothetical protein [Culex quinquefasciatus]|eukprot:XP_001861538.1 conserved hypothetical protein [Culex quinquefasciatus]
MRAHDGPTIITNDDHHRCRPGQQLGGGRGGEEGKGVGRTKRTSLGSLAVSVATVVLVTTILVVPVGAGPRYSSRIVETKSGAIRGVILELNSKYLEPVEVFKAVPYAAPPVENLRYEPPQKLPPWKGTKLADTFGPVCPQNFPDISNRTVALASMPKGRYQHLKRLQPLLANQSEDCLTLNIYVPGSDMPVDILNFEL